MARYFFEHTTGVAAADLDGTELKDLHAARLAAFDSFCDMMKGNSEEFWNTDEWQVRCHDERGLTLLSLVLIFHDAAAVWSPRRRYTGRGTPAHRVH